MERSDIPVLCMRGLAVAVAAFALSPVAVGQARARPRVAPAAATAAQAAETVPRMQLSTQVVPITSRYGVGFISGRCNEPPLDFCSLAARLYHSLGSTPRVRIGTVAGSAAGAASGRLGFILNVPGWQLLRHRRRLTVTLRGTIVHGGMVLGEVDRTIVLVLVV